MKELFQSIVNMSITGSYIILAVMVLRLFLRKLPRRYSYGLWLIPGLRLLFPFSISSALSLFNILKPTIENQQMSYVTAPITEPSVPITVPVQNTATGNILPLQPLQSAPVIETTPLDWWQIWAVIWLIGMLLVLSINVFHYLRTGWYVRTAIRCGEDCWLSDEVEVPFVYGIVKARIILPKGITAEEWPYVLAHERSHIQRKDPLVKLIAFGILCIHWFNPLVWLAFAMMSRDMELSCDEMALKRFPQDVRKPYATALLNLSMRQNDLAFSTVLSFGKSSIKERISAVINSKKPTFWMSAVAILTLLIAAVTLLTNPLAQDREHSTDFSSLNYHDPIVQWTKESTPFTLTLTLPDGWYISEEGELSNQLPMNVGDFTEIKYLYNKNDLIGYIGMNSYAPEAYMSSNEANYWETVCPSLRLGSYRMWSGFASVGQSLDTIVGIMDIEFVDMDYSIKHPEVSMAGVPHMESNGIFAYNDKLAAYIGIAFSADSGVDKEKVTEIAQSLTMTALSQEEKGEPSIPEDGPVLYVDQLRMDWDLFETYFYGVWKRKADQKNTLFPFNSDTLNCTYQNNDGFGARTSIKGFCEDEDYAYMVLYSGAGMTFSCRVAKDDPTSMIVYEENDPHGEYYLPMFPSEMTCISKGYSTVIGIGEVSRFGCQRLEEMYGASPYSLGYEVEVDGIAYEGGTLPNQPTWERYYLTAEPTADSLHFIRQMRLKDDESENAPRYNIAMTALKENGEWNISEVKANAELPLSADTILEQIPKPQIRYDDFTMDFSIFENWFSAQWQYVGHDDYWMTYHDFSYLSSETISMVTEILGFTEDEHSVYMWVSDGAGASRVYQIWKEAPHLMILYDDSYSTDGQNLILSWPIIYQRIKGNDTEITTGPLSLWGCQKIESIYGASPETLGKEVTLSDGDSFRAYNGIPMETQEQITLLSLDANSMSFIRQLIPHDADVDDQPQRVDIQFTAQRQNGAWVITSAQIIKSIDEATAQTWLQVAQGEIEKHWQSFMGETVPEEQRVTSYRLKKLSLFAYDEDEFAVRAISDYGCLGLYHLSANGNFAPDGNAWYCKDDYREYRLKANNAGQFEIIETGTGGVARGLMVLETEFETLLGEGELEPSYYGNEQGDLNFSNINFFPEFDLRNEGSIHYIAEENQLWFAIQSGGQFGALFTAQVDLDNGTIISRNLNGENPNLSAITDKRLAEMARQLYELYQQKGAVLTVSNDDFTYDDFTILEEHFYGKWQMPETGEILSITYDNTTNLGGHYFGTAYVAEDNSWYIQCNNGGYGYLYRIDVSEPDVLYCLGEWGGVELKSKAMYEQRFVRMGKQSDYPPELKVGTLSSLGQYYISKTYGLTIVPIESVTLSDGSQWEVNSSMALEIPYTYLTETPTKNRISCVLQMYPAEIDASDDHYKGIYHALTDIAITYERVGEQWQITSAEKGMAPLEGKLTELEKELTQIWLDLEVSSPNAYSNDKNRSKNFGAVTGYQPVAVEYQTEKNLRTYLGSVFTANCVEKIMDSIVNKTIYIDTDGKVYSADVHRSADLYVGGIRRSSIGTELSSAAIITYDILGSELYGTEGTVLSDNAGEVIGQFQLRAVPTADGWRFDNWYLPY